MSGTITGVGKTANAKANFTIVGAEPYPNLAVNLLNLGSSVTTNTLVNSSTLDFGTIGSATGGTVTFGTGSSYQSGVYSGSVGGQFAAPSLGAAGADAGNFYAAEPGAGITFKFSTTQNFFGMLWGSTDAGNTLTFKNTKTGETYTISGSNSAFASNNGLTSYYTTFNVPNGFNQVTMTTVIPAFEFANVTFSQTTTPVAGTPTVIAVTPTSGTLCLLAGTRIGTPDGEKAIESLAIGDMVLLHGGGAAPVRWVGVQTVSTRFADPLRVQPIRIKAGALAEGVPSRDLLSSPDHAFLVGGVLVQAAALVNGVSIMRETAMPEVFAYYHVELADHSLILAENTPAETFVDNVDRLAFDNWAEHEALYGGEAAISEMELPRAKSVRQVPAALRASLVERAQALFGAQAAA